MACGLLSQLDIDSFIPLLRVREPLYQVLAKMNVAEDSFARFGMSNLELALSSNQMVCRNVTGLEGAACPTDRPTSKG